MRRASRLVTILSVLYYEAYVRSYLGRVLSEQGEHDNAREQLSRSRAQFEQMNLSSEVARLLTYQAEVEQRAGALEAARDALRRALALPTQPAVRPLLQTLRAQLLPHEATEDAQAT